MIKKLNENVKIGGTPWIQVNPRSFLPAKHLWSSFLMSVGLKIEVNEWTPHFHLKNHGVHICERYLISLFFTL
jgi:hypothetical protein